MADPDTSYCFHVETVNWPDRIGSSCPVCGTRLHYYNRVGIRGHSWLSDIWLRSEDGNALLICRSEVCFNMILLDVDKYIRLAF